MSVCKQCNSRFETSKEDLDFIERISPVFNGKKYLISPPTLCYFCRQQRRLAFRNERNLYKRKCDLSRSDIISVYPENSEFAVYEQNEWWSDKWDPLEYGKDFDFERPFFDQFNDLMKKVPRINLFNSHNENCDYVNYTNYSKDSYLIFGNQGAEKCAYCWRVHYSLQCFDSSQLDDCKYCYECLDCDNCYELFYSQNCQNCSQSQYLMNCIGCEECFMCCNLNHKKFHILNKEYSAEDYSKKVREILGRDRDELMLEFEKFRLKFPRKAVNQINCQNCEGDYLIQCKNCKNTFSAKKSEDCRSVYLAENTKDCLDCDIAGWPAEMCYEGTSTCVRAMNNCFSSVCWTCSDVFYCESCFNSQNLFGCIGLKHNHHCILNKQYTRKEYEEIVPKIVEYMRKAGEWGEFFPITLSPFAYNESIVNESYPLLKKEVLKNGWKWKDEVEGKNKTNQANICEVTGKPFKIIQLELDFYKKFDLLLPRKCPDQRYKERMGFRNPRKLWDGKCAKCEVEIKITYPPDRPEIVYCESCYLEEVY